MEKQFLKECRKSKPFVYELYDDLETFPTDEDYPTIKGAKFLLSNGTTGFGALWYNGSFILILNFQSFFNFHKKRKTRKLRNRAVAFTVHNDYSSVSYFVLELHLLGKNENPGKKIDSFVALVDLAGSEKLVEITENARVAETKNINCFLSPILEIKEEHVPYRNSKLTHLLRTSLGRNTKTFILVNLLPTQDEVGETINLLRFSTGFAMQRVLQEIDEASGSTVTLLPMKNEALPHKELPQGHLENSQYKSISINDQPLILRAHTHPYLMNKTIEKPKNNVEEDPNVWDLFAHTSPSSIGSYLLSVKENNGES
ncbi:hypothetical protein J437_LFUL008594 [Ladona fulva]|uniref:Kinesin motor domain-containing protein n=1 Tax=Ladona fulva TaxID=123851 RepID=A0A8K0K784_LADFU|nr:hypothetical protein J437_LFUL008594 [Ladona fulva]